METQVIKVDPKRGGGSEVVRRAVEVLKAGGLVAFPTETVYGVGARADHKDAVRRLRAVKTRGAAQAFTVHLGASDDAGKFAPQLSGVARRLIRKAWPGPLTLIVPVEDPSATPIMAGLNGSAASAMFFNNSVGLRCPDDRIAQSLLCEVGVPVVASSANRSGQPAPLTGFEVLRDLKGRIDLLIDTGRTKYAKASTIVEVTGSSYKVVREGVYDAGIVKRLSTIRLLFVCTGNTCRSPMAAALARRMLANKLACQPWELDSHGVLIQSAGTAGGLGGASGNAISVMARRGIDLTNHESAALTSDMIQQADNVFAMTRSHLDRIVELVPRAERFASLLLEGEDIQDPMGSAEEAYEQCAVKIELGLERRLQEVPV